MMGFFSAGNGKEEFTLQIESFQYTHSLISLNCAMCSYQKLFDFA
jgi:hypothetical protein